MKTLLVPQFSSLSLRCAIALTVVAVALDQNASETRRVVDINTYPWSSIGKIGISAISVRSTCTASVIGPQQILTAAHCLYLKRTAHFVSASEIHFLLGYEKGQYRAHRVGSRYVTSPNFNFAKMETAGEDWAVVYVDEPFPSDTRPLRLAAVRPMPGAKVQTAGYPDDKAHMMTAGIAGAIFLDKTSDKTPTKTDKTQKCRSDKTTGQNLHMGGFCRLSLEAGQNSSDRLLPRGSIIDADAGFPRVAVQAAQCNGCPACRPERPAPYPRRSTRPCVAGWSATKPVL